MNYFELYPGDYLKDTGRLTLVDHGAYLRLMLEYYATEEPLPADLEDLYVIAAAIKPADKAAVKKVAERFFPVGDDGLRHNSRADEEIAKAQKRMAISRENGAKGGRPKKPDGLPGGLPGGIPAGFSAGSEKGGFSKPGGNPEKTHSGEALQTPHAIDPPDRSQRAEGSPSPDRSEPRALSPTLAGECCLAARRGGLLQTNPSHPTLLAAIAEGATPAMFEDTAREAVASGKGFAWVIATIRGRLADAARAPPARPPDTPTPAGPTSKTGQAILALESLKTHGNPVDPQRNLNGPAAAALPQPRTATGQ